MKEEIVSIVGDLEKVPRKKKINSFLKRTLRTLILKYYILIGKISLVVNHVSVTTSW